MKKTTFLLAVLFVTATLFPHSALANDTFSIFLVRHAEKQKQPKKDPALTECGQERAAALAQILKNVPLRHVLSTDYKRTQNTAVPTANLHQLDVESYDPRKLNELAQQLMVEKQDALVVGHSNTTNVVAGLLSNEKIAQLSESDFDKLFQVVVAPSGVRLYTLHQGFTCP